MQKIDRKRNKDLIKKKWIKFIQRHNYGRNSKSIQQTTTKEIEPTNSEVKDRLKIQQKDQITDDNNKNDGTKEDTIQTTSKLASNNEPDIPINLDNFFSKLIEINKNAPAIVQWNEYLITNYSRPKGLQWGKKMLFMSESEAFFSEKYK